MNSTILRNPYVRRILKVVSLSLILLVVYMAFFAKGKTVYTQTTLFSTMSTLATARLYLPQENQFNEAFLCIQDAIREVEKRFNVFNPESELAKLNATAAKEPFHCSDQLWEVLSKAREMHRLSHGAFDITVGPLTRIWDYRRQRKELPSEKEISEALKKVGLDKVRFDD